MEAPPSNEKKSLPAHVDGCWKRWNLNILKFEQIDKRLEGIEAAFAKQAMDVKDDFAQQNEMIERRFDQIDRRIIDWCEQSEKSIDALRVEGRGRDDKLEHVETQQRYMVLGIAVLVGIGIGLGIINIGDIAGLF